MFLDAKGLREIMYLIAFIVSLFCWYNDIYVSYLSLLVFTLGSASFLLIDNVLALFSDAIVNPATAYVMTHSEDARFAVNCGYASFDISLVALFVYGVQFITNFEISCASIGVFVLNILAYVKHVYADYLLKHS